MPVVKAVEVEAAFKRIPVVSVLAVPVFMSNNFPVVMDEEEIYPPVPEVSELAVNTNAPEVPVVVATELAKVCDAVPDVTLIAVAALELPKLITSFPVAVAEVPIFIV